jgi:alpha-galactosidase
VAIDDGAIALTVTVGGDGLARLAHLGPGGGPDHKTSEPSAASAMPLADVLTPGTGRSWSGARHAESALAARLRYTGHTERADGGWREFVITLADTASGLRADVCYRILSGQGALRAWTTLTNEGSAPLVIESVTSFLCGGLPGAPAGDNPANPGGVDDLDVLWSESDWLAEGRWQRRRLRDALPDTNRRAHPANPRGCLGFTSTGSWSSSVYLPMGALVSRSSGTCWAWQIEHNGGWRWEAGEQHGDGYLALLGPANAEHQWRQRLAPGESFSTVPAAVAVSGDGFDDAIGRLTRYRRAARRPHPDHRRLPVIFNDYMNTLMGDPATDRLLPLVSAAARAGAEVFCIDTGWYDQGTGWWDGAGDWQPAAARFPGGLTEVLDHIRAEGMIPGIWLEPEVAGVRTAAASDLPDEAFFRRDGVRVAEAGRYHLDLRHPAAVSHLDKTVDYLAGELGIGYLKLDYNIRIDPGTDGGGESPGAGLLGHNRAYLAWLERVLNRYPDLTIENCSSGAMRADYALLSLLQLQSTSDQQDFRSYPVITAAAPAAIAPEQAATWCYPQPGFTAAEIGFTLCGALLGRMHLSGHLDQMTAAQQDLVAQAVAVYRQIRADIAEAVPFWPLGLPGWTDSWVALGLRGPRRSYLVAWHRGLLEPASLAAAPADPAELALPVPHLHGTTASAEALFPGEAGTGARWDAAAGQLTVTLPAAPSACLVRLTPES